MDDEAWEPLAVIVGRLVEGLGEVRRNPDLGAIFEAEGQGTTGICEVPTTAGSGLLLARNASVPSFTRGSHLRGSSTRPLDTALGACPTRHSAVAGEEKQDMDQLASGVVRSGLSGHHSDFATLPAPKSEDLAGRSQPLLKREAWGRGLPTYPSSACQLKEVAGALRDASAAATERGNGTRRLEFGKSRRICAAESSGETDRLAAGGGAASLPIRERRTAPNGIAAGSSNDAGRRRVEGGGRLPPAGECRAADDSAPPHADGLGSYVRQAKYRTLA